MQIITDERCTAYQSRGHPERPQRVLKTTERLRAQTDLKLAWAAPADFDDASILRAHTPEHFAHIKSALADFDGDTPAHKDIFDHARRSVGAALAALTAARAGEVPFSLMRPPGHHATGAKRVAVYDFDVHHGNGTEAILLDQPGAAFSSIHQHPCYPGTGTGDVGKNCFNFPVAPKTPRTEYRRVLDRALDGLKKFKPEIVLVSAGFDAYARDPLAQETLEAEDFHWLGESFRKLGLPVASVLEGGYSNDLPELILAYLKGLAGK